MISKLKKFLRGEGGITGLETAIILIAFVVVAAVFAFTVLSAGVFSADRGKEAVYSGLAEVSGSMQIMGSVIGIGDEVGDTTSRISCVIFSVANVAGGEPIDFTTPEREATGGVLPTADSEHRVVISYRDDTVIFPDLAWWYAKKGDSDSDVLLEAGEIFEITVPLSATNTGAPNLGTDKIFQIEIKPETGGVIVIERTTPAYIDEIVDLN